jgi:hypothetical protein
MLILTKEEATFLRSILDVERIRSSVKRERRYADAIIKQIDLMEEHRKKPHWTGAGANAVNGDSYV